MSLVYNREWYVIANFRENFLDSIRPGMRVEVYLLSYPSRRFAGRVQEAGWALYQQNGATVAGLPQVEPTLNWVRLSQRFPVRIVLEIAIRNVRSGWARRRWSQSRVSAEHRLRLVLSTVTLQDVASALTEPLESPRSQPKQRASTSRTRQSPFLRIFRSISLSPCSRDGIWRRAVQHRRFRGGPLLHAQRLSNHRTVYAREGAFRAAGRASVLPAAHPENLASLLRIPRRIFRRVQAFSVLQIDWRYFAFFSVFLGISRSRRSG